LKNFTEFHDGLFEGLIITDATVCLFFATDERARYAAVASGVVALTAGGFKAGNIIFEVLLKDHSEITLQDISELYELEEGSPGGAYSESLLRESTEKSLTMLEVNPSYGASSRVLAHSIAFCTMEEWKDQFMVTQSGR